MSAATRIGGGRGDDGGQIARGLGELSGSKLVWASRYDAYQPRARRIHALRQLVLRARLVAVPGEPVRLALQQKSVGAHAAREGAAQQILDDRRHLRRPLRVDQARARRSWSGTTSGERRVSSPRIMFRAFSGSEGNSASTSPASTHWRSGPPLLGDARYVRKALALRIAFGCRAPPAQPRPARFEQRMRPATDELGELLHGAVVLPGASQGLAEPERDVARQRAGARGASALHAATASSWRPRA